MQSTHGLLNGRVAACLHGGAALLLASCGESSTQPAAPAPALEQVEQALSDQVWITTSRDSIELVQRVAGVPGQRLEQRDGPARGDEVALRVPRASLPEISEAQHEEHHRCGGFMLQESEAEAMASMAAPAAREGDRLLLAPSYTIDNAATVEKLLPEAKEPNVLATIRKLSSYQTRFHTSMTGEEAALYIRDSWKALSAARDDVTVELVDHQKTPQPSIKLSMRGASLPDEIVVLGGHMDSISGRGSNTALAPGADDNASGIACLTEILRVAVTLGYRPARTVQFYGYAAEEIGLVGSAEIAAKAKSDGLNVIGVMQLDMTNFTKATMPYIGIVTDYTDKALNDFSAKLIDQYLDIPYKNFACGYGCSDHASWTKNGFPATSPHEADMNQANDRIHTTGDTLAVSKDSAAHSMHFVRFGLAFMAEIAKGKLVTQGSAPACDATRPCANGGRCENGMCVPAGDAGVAGDAGMTTGSGTCATPADCGAGQVCDNGRCSTGAKPSPGCSGAMPCAAGLACVAGACVAPTGAQLVPDAGTSALDAGGGIDGGPSPATMVNVSPVGLSDGSAEPSASRGTEGCAVAAPGQKSSSAWLFLAAASLWLCARHRRER
jgi:leucyl aminopeptidase